MASAQSTPPFPQSPSPTSTTTIPTSPPNTSPDQATTSPDQATMSPDQATTSPDVPPPASDAAVPPSDAELYAASAAEQALPSHAKPSTDHPPDLSALTLDGPDATPDPPLSKEDIVREALDCPCIAAMRNGPCGDSFISAYRCFLESETEPKGMDCMQQFTGMQSCMADHPEEYNMDDEDEDPFAPTSENGGEAKEAKEAKEAGEAVTDTGEGTVEHKTETEVAVAAETPAPPTLHSSS